MPGFLRTGNWSVLILPLNHTYFLCLLKSCASPSSQCAMSHPPTELLYSSLPYVCGILLGTVSIEHILNLSFLGTSFISGQTQCVAPSLLAKWAIAGQKGGM